MRGERWMCLGMPRRDMSRKRTQGGREESGGPHYKQWTEIGRELNATVVPFSFWRSRLRKLLVPADPWTIALDEVNERGHLQARKRLLSGLSFCSIRFQLKTGQGNWASGVHRDVGSLC